MILPVLRPSLTFEEIDRAYAWPDWPVPTAWLRANMVMTVDGAARSPRGLSGEISSDADRRVFGRLRALADVVLAGAGTVRAEGYRPARVKPEFAGRRASAGQTPVPAIAVVSRSLSFDLEAPLFTEASVRTIVLTTASSDPARREAVARQADVVVVGDGDVDLHRALAALHERGLHRVHAEGGPLLLGELAAHGLLDELLVTLSPVLAGGSYADSRPVPRILDGPPLPESPRPLRLHHVLEDAGTLFLSYRAAPTSH
jgi:riboflavin biosynthesis pyrimidine reductase